MATPVRRPWQTLNFMSNFSSFIVADREVHNNTLGISESVILQNLFVPQKILSAVHLLSICLDIANKDPLHFLFCRSAISSQIDFFFIEDHLQRHACEQAEVLGTTTIL